MDCLERFNLKWMPEPNTGCWLWIGAIKNHNYGYVQYQNKPYLAHRFSWLLFKGKIPDHMKICHTCDTTLCVNPSHLFIGTQADNVRDMIKKKRHHASLKEKCKRGYSFLPENLIFHKNGSKMRRLCKTCYNQRKKPHLQMDIKKYLRSRNEDSLET